MAVKQTVFFDDPFWVGVFERTHEGQLSAARVVFGAEPRDAEVAIFINENYNRLEFGGCVGIVCTPERRINPKRLQKQAEKALQNTGVGTKAQQALQMQYESRKAETKKTGRQQKELLEKEKFARRQEKRKEKKKGH